MDSLLFYLVEETIKRNRTTIKLQRRIAELLTERLKIEEVYVKNLKDWTDKVKNVSNVEFINEELYEGVKDFIPKEAEMSVAVHEKLFAMLSSDSGPCKCLMENTGLQSSKESNYRGVVEIEDEFTRYNIRRLSLESDVRKRRENIDENKCQIIAIEEKMSHRSRLTNSRKSAKGPRKVDESMLKLTELRKRLEMETKQKQQGDREISRLYEERKSTLDKMMLELKKLESGRVSFIIHQIAEFNKLMLSSFTLEENGRRRDVLKFTIKAAEGISRSNILDQEWINVEKRAKARKLGVLYKLRDFVTLPKSSQVKLDHESCDQQSSPVMQRKELNKSITANSQLPLSPREIAFAKAQVAHELSPREPTPLPVLENAVSSREEETVVESLVTEPETVVESLVTEPEETDSESSISEKSSQRIEICSNGTDSRTSLKTLDLPNAPTTARPACLSPVKDLFIPPRERPETSSYRPFSYTQVIPLKKEGINQSLKRRMLQSEFEEERPGSFSFAFGRNEVMVEVGTIEIHKEDQPSDDDCNDCDEEDSDDNDLNSFYMRKINDPQKVVCRSYGNAEIRRYEDVLCEDDRMETDQPEPVLPSTGVKVGQLRNVRVIAQHDFTASRPEQISFKKGQVIKQKLGENEEGYAYGWTRENKVTPKRFGWYPSGLVSLK